MATGDIGSVIDSISFAAVAAAHNRIIKVNSSIAAVIYGDAASDQKVSTVEVDAAGQITNALIDSLTWNGAWNGYNSICKRSNDIFVCAYRGAVGGVNIYGYLSAVQISDVGVMPASTEDNAVLESSQIAHSNIIFLTGSVVAVVIRAGNDHGWLKTFTVDGAGLITEPAVDSFEFDASYADTPDILKLSDSVVLLAWADGSGNGHIATIGIDASGNIAAAVTDTYQFVASTCTHPRLTHLTGNIYVMAYEGWGPYTTVVTFEIDSAGNITEPFVDSWYDNRWEGHAPSIVKVSTGVIAVAYRDASNHGQLITIGIDASGNIDAGTIDTLDYEGTHAEYNDIIHMTGNIYLVVYRGGGSDNLVESIDIETPLLAGPHHEMIMKMGP